MKTFSHLWQYLAELFLEREIKTHILCSVSFSPENRAVYEIMSRNTVEPQRPQTIWRMLIACLISKALRLRPRTHTYAPQYFVLRILLVFLVFLEMQVSKTRQERFWSKKKKVFYDLTTDWVLQAA